MELIDDIEISTLDLSLDCREIDLLKDFDLLALTLVLFLICLLLGAFEFFLSFLRAPDCGFSFSMSCF